MTQRNTPIVYPYICAQWTDPVLQNTEVRAVRVDANTIVLERKHLDALGRGAWVAVTEREMEVGQLWPYCFRWPNEPNPLGGWDAAWRTLTDTTMLFTTDISVLPKRYRGALEIVTPGHYAIYAIDRCLTTKRPHREVEVLRHVSFTSPAGLDVRIGATVALGVALSHCVKP